MALDNKKPLGVNPIHCLLVIVFILLAAHFFISPSKALAACTPPDPSYGTDSVQFNTPVGVSNTETYVLWARINASSSSADSFMVNVDSGTCYTVGGSTSIP